MALDQLILTEHGVFLTTDSHVPLLVHMQADGAVPIHPNADQAEG